jgi:hypothetical protein
MDIGLNDISLTDTTCRTAPALVPLERGFPYLQLHRRADSDDPGQGFQLKAATIPIEGGQYWPVGTFMGSQRW